MREVGRRCDQMAVRGFFRRRLPTSERGGVHAQEKTAGRERRPRSERVYYQRTTFSQPMSAASVDVVVSPAALGLMPSTSTDDGASSRSGGSPVEQKPTLWQVNGQQGVTQVS